jgi:dTDP-4-dehydrorhamnose 3,5-epimerase
MNVRETGLAGCLQIKPPVHRDARGFFVKPFQFSAFEALGLPADFQEVFFSHSRQGVIRGLHFQYPPAAQHKLVYCVAGKVLDVVVDLRRDSPTFGVCESFSLSSEEWTMLMIPVGFAHGFATLSAEAVMAYHVTTEHDPSLDSGIRWDSIGFEWPWPDPILSERDRSLEPLDTFSSPFGVDG